jgi:guanylate kinase
MKLNPNTRAVFILPPSYEEWVRRLAQRGSGESQDEIKRRLENAQVWLEKALASGYWHFVINTDLKKAVDDITAFASSPKAELPAGDTRVEHAWHVLGELKKQLNS